MFNMNFYFSLYMWAISCFMMIFYYKHLLMMLISLEFIMMSIFFNMFCIMMNLEVNMFYLIYFLVMVVCEGALGLSMLVMMIRIYGNDYLNSLSVMKW